MYRKYLLRKENLPTSFDACDGTPVKPSIDGTSVAPFVR
jgi:hypothetical protein